METTIMGYIEVIGCIYIYIRCHLWKLSLDVGQVLDSLTVNI